jgi:hypothetical protein
VPLTDLDLWATEVSETANNVIAIKLDDIPSPTSFRHKELAQDRSITSWTSTLQWRKRSAQLFGQ